MTQQPDDLADVAVDVDEQTPEPAPLDEWEGTSLRSADVLDPDLDDVLDVDDDQGGQA